MPTPTHPPRFDSGMTRIWLEGLGLRRGYGGWEMPSGDELGSLPETLHYIAYSGEFPEHVRASALRRLRSWAETP